MTRHQLKRLAALEAKVETAEEVPWTAYTATFQLLRGETWGELRDRAKRWLGGEAVPGMYGLRSPRCREALIFSYHDGLQSERISVGNRDQDGTVYRRQKPDPRLYQIMRTKMEKWLDDC